MKYDMRICSCGRIHMIQDEHIEHAIKNGKRLLLVCKGCGKATLIGANPSFCWDDPDTVCYNMYSVPFADYKDTRITASSFESEGIDQILFSNGLRVPMMNGYYASSYHGGMFADCVFPVEDNEKRITVNMRRFIRETPDDMLEEISHYLIDAFDWSGTKYERE